jgi:hypothetical protein
VPEKSEPAARTISIRLNDQECDQITQALAFSYGEASAKWRFSDPDELIRYIEAEQNLQTPEAPSAPPPLSERVSNPEEVILNLITWAIRTHILDFSNEAGICMLELKDSLEKDSDI